METHVENNKRLALQSTEEQLQCPNCKVSLNACNVAQHYEEEMSRLEQLPANLNENGNDETQLTANTNNVETMQKSRSLFRKVQKNRQNRQKLRQRKRPLQHFPCPICNQAFPAEDIQRHTDSCLRNQNRSQKTTTNGHQQQNADDSHSSSEDDGAAEYEEYEWAGQKRIRVSSMLSGGYASLGMGTVVTQVNNEDEDEDLNVDGDDTHIYGPPQYAESDVIPPTTNNSASDVADEHSVANYMRSLIAEGSGAKACNAQRRAAEYKADGIESAPPAIPVQNQDCKAMTNGSTRNTEGSNCYLQIIESLKSRLRYYEQQHTTNKLKCLICLDDYRNPAISVHCWHVYCEQCWLRSLGARKLCPQCNLITSPKDLRRIYL